MKTSAVSAVASALVIVGSAAPAAALTIAAEPATPAAIGRAHDFRVARVEQAVGEVTFTWRFGDGTSVRPLPS